jgi:hypothetical protein
MADDRKHHHAIALPQNPGIEGQMQAVAWLLSVLDRPENQRVVESFHVNAAVGESALIALLPAGGQSMGCGEPGLAVVETDGLAQQQPSHHPGQEHQMPLITDRAVLTEEADQLSMQLGAGCHGGNLVWFRSPTLPWLPAHPMTFDPF